MLYARVSPHGSTNTSQETSIKAQLEECRRYVLERDRDAQFLEEIDEYKSGKNIDRPGIQRIIESVRDGTRQFDHLVVWHLDRLSRSVADAAPLFELFRDSGVGLICVKQGWDMSTPSGRLMLYFFVIIAQYEREMCSDRTRTKMMAIAEGGKVPYGKLPYGFRRDEQNNLLPDPQEIENVREVFNRVAEGRFSYLDFRREHPEYPLSKSRTYALLQNKIYIGVLEYAGRESQLPTGEVVSRELFQKAQEAASANSRRKAHAYSPRHDERTTPRPLAGKVFCSCGKHMTPYTVVKRDGTRYHYYKCTAPECKKAVSAEALEDEVFGLVFDLATDESILREAWERCLEECGAKRSEDAARLPELRTRMHEASERESRLVDVFASGLVSAANAGAINAQLEAASAEKSRLASEIALAEERIAKDGTLEADFLRMQEEFATYAQTYAGAKSDPAMRQILADLLISRVTLVDDGDDGGNGGRWRGNKPRRFRVSLLCGSPAGVASRSVFRITSEVTTPPWAGRRGQIPTSGARNASVEPLGSENNCGGTDMGVASQTR